MDEEEIVDENVISPDHLIDGVIVGPNIDQGAVTSDPCFCHISGYAVKDAQARKDLKHIDKTFVNVRSMQSYVDMEIGQIARTLGFYAANDGGAATYIIKGLNYNAVDNVTKIQVSNGLMAELIIENEIQAEKLGFKADSNFDCGSYYEKLMSKYTGISPIYIRFSNKKYYWGETLIKANTSLRIKGNSINYADSNKSTLFVPFKANQRFIIKLGGNKEYGVPTNLDDFWANFWNWSFSIEGITFSDNDKPLLNTENKYALLVVEYFTGLKFDLNFSNTKSRCIYLKNTWEIDFNYLSFRNCSYDVKSSAIYIDNVLQDNYSNTTALFFHFIDVETINGTLLRTGDGCNMQNILFNNISVENGRRTNDDILGKPIGNIDSKEIFEECTPYALLEFNTVVHGLQINNINLHNYGNKYYYIDSNNTKGCDVILKLNKNYIVNINSINMNMCGSYQKIFGGVNIDSQIDSVLTINSIIYGVTSQNIGQALALNSDKRGYLFNDITSGNVYILSTNMDLHRKELNQLVLTNPGVYKENDLVQILTNKYGVLRFGRTPNVLNGVIAVYGSEVISKRLKINYPCKITFALNIQAVAESPAENAIGVYYRSEDGTTFGGRQMCGCSANDIDKDVLKSVTLSQEIINQYPCIELVKNGITLNHLDYIIIERT